MSPVLVKVIFFALIAALSLGITVHLRSSRPTVTSATPLVVSSLPDKPLTDFPLMSRAVPRQPAPKRFRIIGVVVLLSALLMLAMSPVAWSSGEITGSVIFGLIGLALVGTGVYLLLYGRHGGLVDDPTATIVVDWRGRRHALIHSHLKSCKYLRSGTGGVTLTSAEKHKRYSIYTGSYDLTNLVKALATLEAEGRFAPESVFQRDPQARQAWLADRIKHLQESLNIALPVTLQERLIEGPLVYPERYSSVLNSAGLPDWYLGNNRVWWGKPA